jgi:hypothetical protein
MEGERRFIGMVKTVIILFLWKGNRRNLADKQIDNILSLHNNFLSIIFVMSSLT